MMNQLQELEKDLAKMHNMRQSIGGWDELDEAIEHCKTMIWEIKLENGMVAVFPDDV